MVESLRTTVAIIGGGVGGLAAAVALRAAGIECLVFERDGDFSARKNGYGMTLSADPKGPLGALGILDRCVELDCASSCHWVFDGDGSPVGYYGRALGASSRDDSSKRARRTGSLRVQRQQLRQVLLEALEGSGVVRWNGRLDSYEETDGGVVASFGDGSTCESVALVGCDGLRSAVRRLKDAGRPSNASSHLEFLGVGVVVGLSTFRHDLVEGRGFYVLDGGSRLFTMPFSSTRTMWQLSFKLEAPDALRDLRDNGVGLAALALAKAAEWRDDGVGDVVRQLIEETEPANLWSAPLYDRPPMDVDAKDPSRVTVLGDACHPMTCFKGQGANQALADAPLLAKCLSAKGKNVAKKLRVFEREMVQRAAPRATASRSAAKLLHSPQALSSDLPSFANFHGDHAALAAALKDRGVHATSHPDLEAAVRDAIATLGPRPPSSA